MHYSLDLREHLYAVILNSLSGINSHSFQRDIFHKTDLFFRTSVLHSSFSLTHCVECLLIRESRYLSQFHPAGWLHTGKDPQWSDSGNISDIYTVLCAFYVFWCLQGCRKNEYDQYPRKRKFETSASGRTSPNWQRIGHLQRSWDNKYMHPFFSSPLGNQ